MIFSKLKEQINNKFLKNYGLKASFFFLSPGRLELIGNHEDHNSGYALVAPIDVYIKCGVRRNNSNIINLISEGYDRVSLKIMSYEVDKNFYGTSESLLRGIITYFLANKFNIGGLDIYCCSDIKAGSGISSSAAFEVLFCTVFNEIFNDKKIDKLMLAKFARNAEKYYFGKPCGLLDQIGCLYDNVSFIDFINQDNPKMKFIPFNLDLYILLTNTNSSHAGLDSYYSEIIQDMKKVSNKLNVDYLGEASLEEFEKLIAHDKTLTKREIDRATHFFNEKNRTKLALDALKNNDVNLFIKQINESGLSSSNLLKNTMTESNYDSSPEKALSIARKVAPNSGHRIHGGGFAGTIISFCKKEDYLALKEALEKEFGKGCCNIVSISKFGCHKI